MIVEIPVLWDCGIVELKPYSRFRFCIQRGWNCGKPIGVSCHSFNERIVSEHGLKFMDKFSK